MFETNQYRVVLLCLLLLYPVAQVAETLEAFNRTLDRFSQVMRDLQYAIRANNRIDELDEAYWREEGYSLMAGQGQEAGSKGLACSVKF